MVTFTRFLLLNLHLLSHVYANEESMSEAVKWLEAERSVLVHLATPDLYFCTSVLKLLTRLALMSRHWTPHESTIILFVSSFLLKRC
jgi:hypothetical protein